MTDTFKVPIRNVFCLLSYVNETPELIKSFNDVDEDLITYDFLVKRFLTEIHQLQRRGFLKNYVTTVEETNTLSGRLLISESMNSFMTRKPVVVCEKDNYSLNIPFNQIMRATLMMLVRNRTIKEETRLNCYKALEMFEEVGEIRLTKAAFTKLQYNRHTFYYKRAINIAQILFDLVLLSHKSGNWSLFSVELDESSMNLLFEKFLFHFYRIEQKEYAVKVEQMKWKLEGNRSLLPTMRTDLSLTHKHEKKKIIMDAKFYKHIFQQYYGSTSFHSSNLYQLFTYLMHQDVDLNLRGILIYPFNGTEVDEKYRWDDRITMEIVTINLDESWNTIYQRLLKIVF